MTRSALLAAVLAGAALSLAGCPLPQALPDYPAGTVTPPRILVDEDGTAGVRSAGDGVVTFVPAGCTSTVSYVISPPGIVDTNTYESVEARWFVNYDRNDLLHNTAWQTDAVQPNADTTNLTRRIPPFSFTPYMYPPPYPTTAPDWTAERIVRVVELVVSNGFDTSHDGVSHFEVGANRTPKMGFETQVFRWVFLTSASVPCP